MPILTAKDWQQQGPKCGEVHFSFFWEVVRGEQSRSEQHNSEVKVVNSDGGNLINKSKSRSLGSVFSALTISDIEWNHSYVSEYLRSVCLMFCTATDLRRALSSCWQKWSNQHLWHYFLYFQFHSFWLRTAVRVSGIADNFLCLFFFVMLSHMIIIVCQNLTCFLGCKYLGMQSIHQAHIDAMHTFTVYS